PTATPLPTATQAPTALPVPTAVPVASMAPTDAVFKLADEPQAVPVAVPVAGPVPTPEPAPASAPQPVRRKRRKKQPEGFPRPPRLALHRGGPEPHQAPDGHRGRAGVRRRRLLPGPARHEGAAAEGHPRRPVATPSSGRLQGPLPRRGHPPDAVHGRHDLRHV